MAKLQQEIAAAFLEKLKESPALTPAMINELRELFSSGKKVKPDDLVRIFSPAAGGEVK